MLDLSILLPPLAPFVLALTASPAFRIKMRIHGEQSLFSTPNFFNHLLADQRGISVMDFTIVAGMAVSAAWVFFLALGVAFIETGSGPVA